MKPVRTISSYVLLVGVMGLSIVGGVVAYQIYAASVKTQTTPAQATAIKPLDGTINQTTVDNLQKRTVYSDSEMGFSLRATPTPEASITPEVITPTPSPESTGSAVITPTPEASESATTQ